MNILLVEDNQTIIKGLKYSFEKNNYDLMYKTSIIDTKKYLMENPKLDLIILDIMLPDGNGFDLFKNNIKKLNIPTIFLTAKDDENDIVTGLNIGAEDYITKPFSTKELLARVNKILLRTKKQSIITIQDIKFDIDKMIVYKNDKIIELTSLEIKLLNLLFMNIGKVVNRNTILDTIWDSTGNDVDDHTVTVYFKRIREKLGTNIITTVKGIGYRIDDEKQN
ncbi:phosphate regulon transcriptional regulatory protein [Clostridium sp. CAG:921]|nr:phosphate regulon transcriptional regulatory protein [Clostridium sp. CAG:921]